MSSRATFATVLLAVTAVVFLGVAVKAGGAWSDARQDRDAAQAVLDAAQVDAESVAVDLGAAQQGQARAERRTDRLSAVFTPQTVTEVVAIQARVTEGSCTAARAATREGTGLPTGAEVIEFAVTASTDSTLDNVSDRWADLLDAAPVQTEIDRCVAEEAAAIEAERQAAEEAAAAAEATDSPIGYSDCLADFPDSPGLCLDLDGDGYAGYPDSG